MSGRTSNLRSSKMTLSFGGAGLQPKTQAQPQSEEIKDATPKSKLKVIEQGSAHASHSNKATRRDKGHDKKPARDHRTMRPDARERFLTSLVEALGLDTIEQLPVFFRQERVMPAKIGLFNDLVERFPNNLNMEKLKYITRPFFRDFAYLRSICDEKQRFDLDMNPVEGEQGDILEKHKQDAQIHIQGKLKGIKKWQQKKQRLAEETADTTGVEQG